VYKQIIKEFKFYDMPWLAEVLAQEMMPYLPHGYDLLVPVPLHPNRLHERGYNQSELLTRALSRYSGIPWQHSLKRVRDTPHQTGLNREERLHNLHNAFSLKGADTAIKGKRIILIDDVFTTGSTLLSCAKVLHQHGAKEITSCTLASGQARF
jgi:ComF family protein